MKMELRTLEKSRSWWRWLLLLILISALGAAGWGANRVWPRELVLRPPPAAPGVELRDNRLIVRFPTGVLLARVKGFDDEILAYLYFEYLRSRPDVTEPNVLLTVKEAAGAPRYEIYMVVENDLLASVPYLCSLIRDGYFSEFDLRFSSRDDLAYKRQQSLLFLSAYNRPIRRQLESVPSSDLIDFISRFLTFKSSVDPRVRRRADVGLSVLSPQQSNEMAADIVAVASFYSLPLDFFLGIGAMENNYLDVNGDVGYTVWKKQAEKGDIVLKRHRGKVLVWNYSVGPWQITRETLRYAHRLYLQDKRDYSTLPERLRPPQKLDLDNVTPAVLTTYAGLLFRDLLDHFGGDVEKAVGAYNGGPRHPNEDYAVGVTAVADYARRILEQIAALNGRSVAENTLAIAPETGK